MGDAHNKRPASKPPKSARPHRPVDFAETEAGKRQQAAEEKRPKISYLRRRSLAGSASRVPKHTRRSTTSRPRQRQHRPRKPQRSLRADSLLDNYVLESAEVSVFGSDGLPSMRGAVLPGYSALVEQLTTEEFVRLVNAVSDFEKGRTGELTVPLHRLLRPDTTYLSRANIIANMYESLADAAGDSPSIRSSIALIVQNETLRTFLAGKLDTPVQIEVLALDPIELSFEIRETTILTHGGQIQISSLDAVAPVPLYQLAARANVAARQLAAIRFVESKSEATFDDTLALADKMTADPGDYSFQSVRQLQRATGQLLSAAAKLQRTLLEQNQDIRPRLDAAHDRARRMYVQAMRAYEVGNKHRNTNLPGETPGQTYERKLSLEAWQTNLSPRGAYHGVNWAATKAWSVLGDVFTGGGQSLEANNASLYQSGRISYNEYKLNTYLNLGRVGVSSVIGALTAGWASRIAGGWLASGGSMSTSSATLSGTFGGASFAFGQAISSDTYALAIAKIYGDNSNIGAFHRATIGGPKAWATSAIAGSMLGGSLGWLGAQFEIGQPRGSANEFLAEIELYDADAIQTVRERVTPVNRRVNVGGGLEANSEQASYLNPIVAGTGGPMRGIPNHVRARFSEIGEAFLPGSVDLIYSSRLPYGTVDWSKSGLGAYRVLTTGGRLELNIWTQSQAEIDVILRAFSAAGFREVSSSFGPGAGTMIFGMK